MRHPVRNTLHVYISQSWTWIGFIHGLDWIGLGDFV